MPSSLSSVWALNPPSPLPSSSSPSTQQPPPSPSLDLEKHPRSNSNFAYSTTHRPTMSWSSGSLHLGSLGGRGLLKRVGFLVGLVALGLWAISLSMDGQAGRAGGALLEGWGNSQVSTGGGKKVHQSVSFVLKGKERNPETEEGSFVKLTFPPSLPPSLSRGSLAFVSSFFSQDRSSSFRSTRDRCLLGTLASRRDGSGEAECVGEQSWRTRGDRRGGRDGRLFCVEYGGGRYPSPLIFIVQESKLISSF